MRTFRAIPILFALSLVACVDAESVVKTRAANDFHCNEEHVDVTNVGGTSFQAKGCGYSEVYDCTGSDSYRGTTTDYTCVPEGKKHKKDSED
jgi:hypothetical protein